MSQDKATVCETCTDFWDCTGKCSNRMRKKREQHSVDEQTMLKDLEDSRRNFRAQVIYL